MTFGPVAYFMGAASAPIVLPADLGGEQIMNFVRDVGVPAAIAFFVLWRLDMSLHDVLSELKLLRIAFEKAKANHQDERP